MMNKKRHKFTGKFTVLLLLLTALIGGGGVNIFAQRAPRISPPRVEGQTTVGTINGQPITGNDLILPINPNSPFMPPLDGSPIPLLEQFENIYPATPTASPVPSPITTPKPPASGFSGQITNLMKTGQEWLFKSLLDVIIKPMICPLNPEAGGFGVVIGLGTGDAVGVAG